MSEVTWLLVVFVFLNILDAFTTWLGLHKLPEKLKGKEANILFKDAETHFWSAMMRKGVLVLFGCWLFYHLASVHPLKVLNLVFVVVVLNNSYVYLSRRMTGKRTRSPMELSVTFFRKLRLPERVSRILGFYVLFGLVIVGCYLLVGVIW